MKSIFCKDTPERQSWAIALSFASASLLNLEALHPDSYGWVGLGSEQSFAISATLATISVLLGSLVLAKLIGAIKDVE